MPLLLHTLLLAVAVPLHSPVAVADVAQGSQPLPLLLQGAVYTSLPLAHIIFIITVCCCTNSSSTC
jgi:hypothetical protein